MNKRYFNLLKQWCDKLIELQVPESYGKLLAGGVLCPACHYIQSMPVINTASALTPYLNLGEKNSSGGINIDVGDIFK